MTNYSTTNPNYKFEETILYIYDNPKYGDNYTIAFIDENGDYATVHTNACQSIWSVSEWAIDPQCTEDTNELGNEIEWGDLPPQLQRGLLNYFDIDPDIYPISEPVKTEYQRRFGD